MNNRDPFDLRRTQPSSILRGTTFQAAAVNITQRVLESSAQAIETGKQVVEEMSFQVPKTIPSFNNPQRELEDRLWGASGATARSNGYAPRDGLMTGMGGIFDRKKDLPMYKDKPFSYASSRRRQPIWRRKRFLAGAISFFLFVLYLLGFFGSGKPGPDESSRQGWRWLQSPEKTGPKVDWAERRERVKEAFTLSWDAYERYAWGYDEFHPVSKQGKQMAPDGMGWIIVDSLDTLMLMNLTSRLVHAREWMTTKLSYDQDQEVNTFETTIRMLGGLLSAHYLSTTFPNMAPLTDDDEGAAGEDLYLEKAKDLADRLTAAYDSPSGVPYASVNLQKMIGVPSHADNGASSTAEAATLQLEMKYLAKLTGEKLYWDLAEKVMEVIDNNNMPDGLLPIYIYASTGEFKGQNIRLGSRGDSYYEYLIKQYLQTSKQEPIYLDLWDQALNGVRKHLITYSKPSGFTVLGERPSGLYSALSPKMDHLVCFMPGTIALAVTEGLTEAEARKLPTWSFKKEEEMRLARELMQTCWGMYKVMKTGLAPEIAHFRIAEPAPPEGAPHNPPAEFDEAEDAEWRQDYDIKSNDKHNLQRPETVESLFYMWRITGDEKYREWGWEMFKSFIKYTAVEEGGGFTSLNNADTTDPPSLRDNMESFWLAETLKYFYLLFSDNDLLPLDQIVINTEAHPFPRFNMQPLFSTGWARKPRDADGNIIREAKVQILAPATDVPAPEQV